MNQGPARRGGLDMDLIKSGFNLFEDKGTNKKAKEENKKKAVKKSYRPSTEVNTQCVVCGTKFTVSKGLLVQGKYTCSTCIKNKGTR